MQDRLLEDLMCPGGGARALRVLFVYAHPDDEALAIGGRLQRFANSLFVQVTDGAPLDNMDGARAGLTREQYRMMRERESAAAFRAGDVPHPRRKSLKIPDKEAALHLAELTDGIERLITDEDVEVIVTHPYEGGHADHDACAFAVHTAVRELARDGRNTLLVVESAFYHGAGGTYQVGHFLPHAKAGEELVLTLSEEEQKRKQAIFAAFATQAVVLRDFSVAKERFRAAPPYDFTQPPHGGPVYYERFIAGMTPERFCSLASDALRNREVQACR